MATLYLATGDGLVVVVRREERWRADLQLVGVPTQCVAADPERGEDLYCGTFGEGLWVSHDAGATWQRAGEGIPYGDVMAVAVNAGVVWAGTEPSALFCSDDEGETWRELEALLELPSRPTWSFPPRPWTSHVRWIAPSPHDADVVLVGIELGGLMRSSDRGASWEDHRPGAQRDVHSLAWHPHAEGRAYEAGGGGAAWSEDGGETWHAADDGRDRHYTWSVAVDPDDAELWYVSASTGPFAAHGRGDPQARIYRRHRAEWRPLRGGLPEPIPAMPYALVAADGRLFAGLADGQVWESADRGDTWNACTLHGNALTALHALAFARD